MSSGSPVADADLFYLAKSPFGAGDSRKVTGAQVKAYTGAMFRAASGSPEGVVTCPGTIGVYYTLAGGLWVYGGAGNTNTGWINLIAE